MKEYVHAKLHNIIVTDKSIKYHGSVTICKDLLIASGIEPYQKVDIVNLNTGNRWTTYAVPGEKGSFKLNGGGARLGEIGDKCVVITYQTTDSFQGATVIFCDKDNNVEEEMQYE